MQLYSLGGLIVGMLAGTVLAVWAAKKKHGDLAVIGFSCCVFFGSIGGLIFVIPIVAIFLWLIKRADNKSTQVSTNEPNINGNDKYYDEVARELQEKPMVPGLWTKAFAEMSGDDAKARALYIKYRVAQLAEAGRQELEKDRLAKQLQEKPKRARKIKIIFAVAILAAIFVIIAVHIPADSGGFISQQRKLAEKGDSDAAYTLGLQYYCGDTNDGVAIDYGEAFKWFLEAAGKNHADAQWFLGGCYAEGKGVEKNEVEAVRWYRKSAEQGNRDALYDLGPCYQYGEGVQKDEVEAYKWYSIAVAHGAGRATENLTNIESQITPEQIAKAKQLAAAFVPRK
ncbi:MAG: tetratricopeptide repeat protein [Limisphaerales bacterium]